MIPQLEAIAMLNNMFESHDGAPVDNAVLTRKDYGYLVKVLLGAQRAEAGATNPEDRARIADVLERASKVCEDRGEIVAKITTHTCRQAAELLRGPHG